MHHEPESLDREPEPRRAVHRLVPIVENLPIARDTYRLRLADATIAGTIRPGQFVMIRPVDEGSSDPLLGRPLALYDVVRDASGACIGFDVVYLVIGRGTAAMARRRPGERLPVWGPLGNGFGPAPGGPVIFVAGGIGQTPFLALGRAWLGTGTVACTSATLLYGVRTAALLAGVEDFRAAGIEVEVATDDGTAGHHGFVTDLLARRLERGERPARVVGCGPPAMLAALARLAARHGVDCEVSLENHMACGFGACFSCVAPIRQPDGSTDLRRVCVEGPVFSAESVSWGQ
jgi:dihydroorotate dehydrogenase electron transfer subunit